MTVAVGAVVAPGVFYALRSSEPAQAAFRAASESAGVKAALGEPIELGWLVTGSMSTGSSGGNADLTLRVSGPKATGKLHVRAEQSPGGAWRYHDLRF